MGDEFHYLYKCTYFNECRAKYLPNNPHNIPDEICMQSLFEGSKDHLQKLSHFLKLIMKKFAFKECDADICSVTKKNRVIATRSGRQVKPPRKLCLWSLTWNCKSCFPMLMSMYLNQVLHISYLYLHIFPSIPCDYNIYMDQYSPLLYVRIAMSCNVSLWPHVLPWNHSINSLRLTADAYATEYLSISGLLKTCCIFCAKALTKPMLTSHWTETYGRISVKMEARVSASKS